MFSLLHKLFSQFYCIFSREKQYSGTTFSRMETVFTIQDTQLAQFWLAINGWPTNGYTKEDKSSADHVAFTQTNNEILSLSYHSP